MLKVTVPAVELWDEQRQEFIKTKEQVLQLEHSLVSLSKWESKWCKPFLAKEDQTEEELLDYIKCMTITQNVDPNVYIVMPNTIRQEIMEYINLPMTATWINEDKSTKKNSKQTTSELIYYWMIAANIPFECQKWHLNRLITLIRVCNIESQPPKMQSMSTTMSQNAAINAARKKKLKTRG